MSHGAKINISVEYPPTGDKLEDHAANRDEIVGALKSRVLAAFSLKEGVDDKGQLLTYVLFHGRRPLVDPSATIGSIAGDASNIKLELERERHFFYYMKHKIVSPTASATGAQIKAMIKAVDTSFDLTHVLIEEGQGGHEDQAINDNQTVSLEVDEAHPAKHFFSKPPTTFGAG
ncbi:hypothetical protein G8O24_26435 [Bradyrhizobium sp. INPA01-394B]|uniref:Uncharacterized protein n=1 Tax=Bradyrhizobium campsiandrae TaxID=1729892 RepID=A0ABR7UA49_9BRAD|nr:hypothetical protein [Bradyrhizobium campsiandrae]MBC9880869.1 hypothetical protein [Bradyrhizobium campsiandrae]MBC9980297.1 hypothetical protein [Bradyrhizobium campsiandrae]